MCYCVRGGGGSSFLQGQACPGEPERGHLYISLGCTGMTRHPPPCKQ